MRSVPAATGEFVSARGVGAGVFGAPEPRVVGFVTLRLGAAVGFAFRIDAGFGAEEAGPFGAHISGKEEGAD